MKGANAAKMKRLMSRKSHSWWWDSHINPKNSKWLAENLEGKIIISSVARVFEALNFFSNT